jgi:hypothetical protein
MVESSSSSSCYVKFRLQKALTKVGQNVYLVGSVPALKMWNASQGIKMTTNKETYPIWETESLPILNELLESGNELLEYKYIVKSTEFEWEGGDNRILDLTKLREAMLESSSSEMLVIDKQFNDVTTWPIMISSEGNEISESEDD